MINTFVHLMIQKIKKFLDCQTLPEKYFGLPEFSTQQYQILQMGGRLPPPAPLSPTPMTKIKATFRSFAEDLHVIF